MTEAETPVPDESPTTEGTSRWRIIGARVLTVVAILLAVVGMLAFYVEHTALDEDGFETISRTRAGASGKYAFTGVTLPRSSILRAVAPRFKGSLNHAKDRITTAEVAVPAVRQSGRIAAMPGIVQQGHGVGIEK